VIFAMGFRVFFLLAGVCAVLLVPVWLAALSGHALPGIDMLWHAHEMLFGFVGAVLGGFFLTAVPKWTKSPPLTGAALAGLAGLWMAGRVARVMFVGPAVALDVIFLLVLAAVIGRPIFRARSVRNAWFPLLVLIMAIGDAAGHLSPAHAVVGLRVAVFAALSVVVIFGGRITPLFTRNALKATVRPRSRLDDAAIGCALILVPLAAFPELAWPTAAVAGVGALLNALRMRGWHTTQVFSSPILWVLHAGYAWVAVALGLWSLAALRPDVLSLSAALHAVTVGVLGTYTLGMMSRVALGHTGRTLIAPAPMAVSYGCMVLAGVVRVVAPGSVGALHASGTLWTIAMGIFLWVYAPMLVRPRVDGAPG